MRLPHRKMEGGAPRWIIWQAVSTDGIRIPRERRGQRGRRRAHFLASSFPEPAKRTPHAWLPVRIPGLRSPAYAAAHRACTGPLGRRACCRHSERSQCVSFPGAVCVSLPCLLIPKRLVSHSTAKAPNRVVLNRWPRSARLCSAPCRAGTQHGAWPSRRPPVDPVDVSNAEAGAPDRPGGEAAESISGGFLWCSSESGRRRGGREADGMPPMLLYAVSLRAAPFL